MLTRIIATALRNRAIVLVLALVVGGYGLFRAAASQIDVLPDLNRPIVTIMTEGHGMVPEQVERLVTWPIEQVMNGATGVYRVRSASGLGLSVVNVEFEWGTDIYRDRQIVTEKLQIASASLPPGVQPILAPISSIMGQIQMIGFRSSNGATSALELRRRIDRDISPRLQALNGIAQVITIGGQPSEVQVIVDSDKLRAFNVTLQEVAEATKDANVNVAGGFLHIGAKGPLVTVSGRLENPEQLKQAVIRDDPRRPIRIEDVAKLSFSATAIPTGTAGINASPGVIVVINKQPGVDTMDLTRRIGQELDQIRRELPGDILIDDAVFQQAAFIERAIDNVLVAVRDGGLLVVVILFLFLLNLRTTLITLSAIPLSVAIASLVFAFFDLTINTMTLGGLAVAIGTLVDDAIVDVENVYRRLKQNELRAQPEPRIWVLFLASSEIRKPVLYGTLLVTVVYLPLFFLSGIEGRLFAPIGLAYILSVMASLLVALTVTPVLCYYLLGSNKAQESKQSYGGWLVQKLHSLAAVGVRFSLSHTRSILTTCAVLLVLAGAWLSSAGSTFLPPFNEGTAQINLVLPPDTSLKTSDRLGQRLEQVIKGIDGVASVARRTGRAPGDEHAMPVSLSEAIVNFDPDSGRSREEVIEEIRAKLAEEFPGVATAVEQPLAHLMSALLSGVHAQVAIKVSGPDLAILRKTATKVENAVRGVEGVRDLYTEPQVLIDQVEIAPRRQALARLGISTEQLAKTVELAMGGEEISRLQLGQIAYPIKVRLEDSDRRNLLQIEGLYLRRKDGELARVGDVADVRVSKTPNNINRENVQRRIVIQHNIGGRSLGEVVADVEKALEPIRDQLTGMPGYALRISGQFEAQQEATRMIFGLSILSVLLMVLILYLHFHSLRIATLVLLSRPVAFLGAVLYLALSAQVLSIATLVGFIALLGMAARNAILLVDHYLHLMREEGWSFGPELLVQAAQERIVPVLMTALTSGIGLVPLALAADQPGRELLYPVATVIIGGLVTNTLLDFLVMPGLFARLCRKEAERVAQTSTAYAEELGPIKTQLLPSICKEAHPFDSSQETTR
ncbi:MAG: CusA/CzcA family heavy metal efflux RND transporter [Planctomycetota bacterium]|nr:MAG: CusA/CzcA family heavy metal efflux RND transporter [Planctomycetota bacterium]